MSQVQVTYDGDQHCTASQANGKTVALDCPYTGKGEEFSPGNLVGSGLAGCMLLSMGVVARRDDINISGTRVEVEVTMVDKPEMAIGALDVTVNMPDRDYSETDRSKLARAAAACAIKHSFRPETKISTKFKYSE